MRSSWPRGHKEAAPTSVLEAAMFHAEWKWYKLQGWVHHYCSKCLSQHLSSMTHKVPWNTDKLAHQLCLQKAVSSLHWVGNFWTVWDMIAPCRSPGHLPVPRQQLCSKVHPSVWCASLEIRPWRDGALLFKTQHTLNQRCRASECGIRRLSNLVIEQRRECSWTLLLTHWGNVCFSAPMTSVFGSQEVLVFRGLKPFHQGKKRVPLNWKLQLLPDHFVLLRQ